MQTVEKKETNGFRLLGESSQGILFARCCHNTDLTVYNGVQTCLHAANLFNVWDTLSNTE